MEHYQPVVVIEAPFTWDDVGSWQALARLRGHGRRRQHGRRQAPGHPHQRLASSARRDDHLVVTLGLKDCIVVHTPDATLVANKSDEESLRKITALLAEKGWTEYL